MQKTHSKLHVLLESQAKDTEFFVNPNHENVKFNMDTAVSRKVVQKKHRSVWDNAKDQRNSPLNALAKIHRVHCSQVSS